MGFLTSAEAVVARALAVAMAPPPPPDITRWCADHIVFDERSPFPGRFNIDRFPWLAEIHACLSPEHPAREVTIMGSAQIGKTVGIINPTVAAWHEYGPLDSLVVHPTMQSAKEWLDTKWMPMRRQIGALRRIFGEGRGENRDNLFYQETAARTGSLKIASAGSPNDLAGTTRRLVIMDDVAKFEGSDKGDPEALAESRAAAFYDAKILRVSTPQIAGACRISRAYARSDRRVYQIPCPSCGTMQALEWENMRATLDPERPAAAHFTCIACGAAIRHEHKETMLRAGRWVARNPAGDHPGYHLWSAYSTFQDWRYVAQRHARVMGWTSAGEIQTEGAAAADAAPAPVDAETEQVFYNDVLGLPYEQATGGLDWERIRNRVENAAPEETLPVGTIPAGGFVLTAGVDCQDDRLEVHVVAHMRNRRRHMVDYRVIPHHIGTEEGRAALTALLRASWRTSAGLRLPLDALAIDGGTWTEEVWSWAKMHPWARVIVVKGASTQSGPPMQPMKYERRKDGKLRRRDKRGYMLNVSLLKAEFYSALEREDPAERGHVGIARGLGDEYFRQLCSERRVLKRNRAGVITSGWELVEPSRRNEALDTALYAEAAARRRGWVSMTDNEWDALEAERSAAPSGPQPDLFDAAVPVVAPPRQPAPAAGASEPPRQPRAKSPRDAWVNVRDDWL